jgi:hypothetical protein
LEKENMRLRSTFLLAFFGITLVTLIPVDALGRAFSGNGDVEANQLQLTLNTDKSTYRFGDPVQIFGNLTFDGLPVDDGLVALQVDDSIGGLVAIRTVDTGIEPSDNWQVEILQVETTDSLGTPKDTFRNGQTVFFEVTVTNHLYTPTQALITITVLDVDMIPLGIPKVEGTVPPGTSIYRPSLPLSDVTLGEATVYANAYTKLPELAGTAYCPEQNTSFTISDGSASAASDPPQYHVAATPGFYNSSFRLPRDFIRVGNYTIYAICQYEIINFALGTTKFEVIVRGNVNNDNAVDIFDAVIVALAFGSQPSDPNWDPRADINQDDLVDIFDMVIVALDFGLTIRP